MVRGGRGLPPPAPSELIPPTRLPGRGGALPGPRRAAGALLGRGGPGPAGGGKPSLPAAAAAFSSCPPVPAGRALRPASPEGCAGARRERRRE